ncbi:MAG: low molecular weight phosphotyrosine protein phosphatase [Bacteroidales bacterium]|nr:low molecular weight phosphotyrosine protein phosphatase [Bacteroidales bacterium]
MKRILFVCHGNICRSPMAEFVMKKMVSDAGIADQFEIASAATSTEEIGNPIYPPARRKLAEHGISCEGKTARQITRRDYEHYDYIVAMDINNLRNLQRVIGEDKLHKISLLLNYTDHPRDVADPWYTGNFEATWQDVNDGCKGLLKEIECL